VAFLEINHLYKDYGPVEVLKDIGLSIEEGGFLVLVGPSGCGKSTLLYTIAGLESVTRGEVRIDGRTVNDLPPSKRDIAMVFQSYALYPSMNVAENMGFGMEMRGVPKAERRRAVAEVAKGIGARARPSSSAMRTSSSWPKPAPPHASGIAAPSQPISAAASHSSRLIAASDSRTERASPREA